MMYMNRGPYGSFMTENLTDETVLSEYALELLQSGMHDCFLKVYTDYSGIIPRLSFEYTGFITLNEFDENYFLTTDSAVDRRKSIGNLFISIINASGHLLSPETILLNPEYIFTDSEGKNIKLCMKPVETDECNSEINSLESEQIEELLNHHFFSDVLSKDEMTDIVFSIQSNDCNRLYEICSKIMSTEPVGFQKKGRINLIYFSGIFTVLAFVFMPGTASCFLTLAALITLVIWKIRNPNLTVEKKSKPDRKEISQARSEILFSDEKQILQDRLPFLTISSDSNCEIEINKAIYTEDASIGSDRFLSDICIMDDSISAVHCRITYDKGSYFITDVSRDGKTFVEDRRIIPNTPFEIKNGQKLTVGKCPLIVKIGFSQ